VKRVAAACVIACAPGIAAAEPLRLRADALATAQSPSGLVSLEADGDAAEDVRAEAVLWLGDDDADALVADVEATRGRVTARAGRFVGSAGALRPVHVDGLGARARLPARLVLEGFAGVPVVADGASAWDWVAAARASRLVGDWGAIGVGYLQQREQGRLSSEELGVDGGAALGARSDLASRFAFDLIHGGIADAQVSASTRRGAWRFEAYAGERSAMRLLPATSLFSVLGDVPSRRAGLAWRWRAAPRLDLRGTLGARDAADEVGEDVTVRADLRLDDRGDGLLGVELRREGAADGGWSGARGVARVPVGRVVLSAELELAIPDEPRMGTGTVWPWALVACSTKRGPWEAAAAIEASASATESSRVDALIRIGRTWGAP
jgi:hypothetical protein